MRDRCKILVSFSFNFTYTSLQDTVLEKKCLVVRWITNSKKNIWSRCATAVKKLAFLTQFYLQVASRHNIREEMSCYFVDNK